MKILILGAGSAQIDAIEYCKSKGWTVYGCSYTNTDRGIPMLDHFKQVDIKDAEGVAKYAEENEIDVVYSVGSDLAMPTVMRVGEMLNKPHFISSKAAMICQNKSVMRTCLGDDFKGNIPFVVASSLEEAVAYNAFPAMMKPTDSQGQRGCYRVDSVKDIEEHFESSLGYSNEGRVIIEKFVDGPEVSVNAYVANGKVVFALVSDRYVFEDLPGGIIKEHGVPSVFTDDQSREEAKDLAERIANKLEINNGPVYFQMKLDGNSPVVLEVTPRLDGCHMWNLIKHYCGVDLLDMTFRHLIYNELPEEQEIKGNGPMKLRFLCEKTGAPYNRANYDVSNAKYLCWYYETGETVKKLNGFMEKGGYVIE